MFASSSSLLLRLERGVSGSELGKIGEAFMA
jgi:hypothetical protein